MRRSLTLAILVACGGAPAEDKPEAVAPAAVTCKVITSTSIDEVIEVSGVIAPPPKLDAIISSPVVGRVAQVLIEEGDQVAAGALLAVIEDPALPAGSIEARAAVASAKAAKEGADLELARATRLVETGIGARRDLDEARAKAAATTAELEAANARAGLASKQLARRELRAPHAGVVLHLWKRVGESVDGTTATPVAEVADLTVLELRAQVPPTALAPLRDAMPATIRVIGIDEAIPGKVARVAPAVDPTTLLGTIRIQLDGTRRLPIGSAATARIAVAKHAGLVVPPEAIRRSMVGSDEVVVCENTVAKIRAVTIGMRDVGGVEIATGLKPGDKIVVDHVLGLEDGQPLVTGAAAPAGSGEAGR